MDFVHLHCHTQYSLLDGAIKINDLVSTTKEYGQTAVAITDHGVLFGLIDFYNKATKAGIKPILGCEVYLAPADMETKQPIPGFPKHYHLVLLAQNEQGYKNLIKLVSLANTRGFYYKPRVDKKLLAELNGGLIALSACLQGEIPYWLLRGNEDKAGQALEFYRSTFDGRFFLEIQANGLPDQDKVNPELVELSKRYDLPVVATNDCHYLKAENANAHEALLCIQTQNTLQDKDHMRFETDQLYLKSPQEMAECFAWIPEALDETVRVAESCNVEIPKGKYYFPVYPAPQGKSLEKVIQEKAWEGLQERMGAEVPDEYRQRLTDELDIIISMGFPSYFLIVADYINYAKNNGIPVGPGRGSAAGSLVAYSLGITDIDPIRWGLLFERFLNPERRSMPDIDVDFCQEGRDRVIDYVKQTYGQDYVSQITTFGNMKAKAVVRDVGRVLGMSFAEVDKIAKLIPNELNITLDLAIAAEPRLKELMVSDSMVTKLIDIARALEGLNRHASVHAGGVVISDKRPLTEHIPVYLDKKKMLISQYDKDCVEQVGLIKFDMLGLKTLTVIDKTLEILHSKGIELDIAAIDLGDKATYALISEGDTSSVFQLESTGMKQMLRDLKPEKFEDIIAAVALYRPGPMDLIPLYILRRHGREKIEYPHPMLEQILQETYGIIIYQEQVMQIAQKMSGYSLSKADLLRRAMGKKKPQEMEKQRGIFIEGALKRDISEQKATEIFDLMEKFANYGFNKSHAAAYALVAYRTAYLKAHHFREFMAANLTLDFNNTDKVVRHIAECRQRGVEILSPDINESRWEFVTADEGIRFGLGAIKNVGKGAVEIILNERQKGGKIQDLYDFVHRINLTKVNRRVIESLIKSGAFDSLHANRRSLMEVLDVMIESAQSLTRSRMNGQETLFSLEEFTNDNPVLIEIPEIPDWNDSEKLAMERDVVGFYISGHPLHRYKEQIKKFANANTLNLLEIQGLICVAGLINSLKVVRTKRGELMARGILEDLQGAVPIIFFPQCYSEYQSVISGEAPVIIKGKVNQQLSDKNTDKETEQESNHAELLAEEVYPIGNAEVHLAKNILVRVPGRIKADEISALKETIENFKGSCQLSFEIDTLSAVIQIDAGQGYSVNPTGDFITRLQGIVGPGSVEIR